MALNTLQISELRFDLPPSLSMRLCALLQFKVHVCTQSQRTALAVWSTDGRRNIDIRYELFSWSYLSWNLVTAAS